MYLWVFPQEQALGSYHLNVFSFLFNISFKQNIGYFLLSIHNIILLFIVRIENKHTDFVNLISNPFCSTHCYIVVVAFDVKKCVYLADLFMLCYRKMLGLQWRASGGGNPHILAEGRISGHWTISVWATTRGAGKYMTTSMYWYICFNDLYDITCVT